MKVQIDPLDYKSIRKAINKMQQFEKKLNKNERTFLSKVAIEFTDLIQANFDNAEYDGVNDVKVFANIEEHKATIKANGQSVMFIEFGTGTTLGNGYRGYKPPNVVPLGEYGLQKGKNPPWEYVGEPGTNGVPLGNGKVLTYGNIPNECIYRAIQDMMIRIPQIAMEVYKE